MNGDEEEEKLGKNKLGSQLDKQKIGKCRDVEEEKMEEFDIIRLIHLIKEKIKIEYDETADIVSRSPMRNHDCHQHAAKPYDYPDNVSRVYGGVTRVVEAERPNPTLYRRLYTTLQAPNVASDGHVGDVDLRDINAWLNLCKKDPKLLSDFVEDCQNELSKRDMSNFYTCRTSKNGCSNVSSQFASPAQSPSEQSVTSPESATCDDNSLYQSKSPNIPHLDGMNLKAGEDGGEKTARPGPGTRVVRPPYLPPVNHLNVAASSAIVGPVPESGPSVMGNGTIGSTDLRPVDPFPNIGTVMLNLAEDSYESTIDLNQFSTVCDTQSEPAPVPAPASNSATTSTVATVPAATTERDALNQRLDPKVKVNAWARISQLDIDQLGKGDEEGDTQLMILLVSEKLTLEYVYVIVERLLREKPEYLSCRNDLNQDALYLAAFKLIREPIVASYIAEAFVRGKQDVNKKYEGGNTLLHCLCRKGDSHAKVLERLVKLRHPNKTLVFDLNKKNNRGFTPLHVACEAHCRDAVHSYQTVKILIENGADCTARDYKDENTPLHTLINESCDVDLIRVFLENERRMRVDDGRPSAAVVPNRQGNTALHLSCGRNALAIQHQKDVIRLLLRHGALIHLKNINGCVPSVLLDNGRKQEVKAILHGHRQKLAS